MDGTPVGETVGIAEGATVGASVGKFFGFLVSNVGLGDGNNVGMAEG